MISSRVSLSDRVQIYIMILISIPTGVVETVERIHKSMSLTKCELVHVSAHLQFLIHSYMSRHTRTFGSPSPTPKLQANTLLEKTTSNTVP